MNDRFAWRGTNDERQTAEWFARAAASGLRAGDPRVWTALLRGQPEWHAATVRRVTARRMQTGWSGMALRRYDVMLDDGRALALVGKRIGADEARILTALSERMPVDMPRLYFAQDGWCVMEALPPGKLAGEWTVDDARAALTNLARLHAAFWERPPDWVRRIDAAELGRQLDQAARGLERVERMGGWPGLIEPGHLRAMRRALDERERFVAALAAQPVTLLHGDPWMPNWHIAGARCVLLDWRWAATGPAVWDVNYFLEIAAANTARGQWQACLPPIARDEAIVFYLDQLESTLGRRVEREAFASALPAAFVVNTLALWMGFVEDYGVWASMLLPVGRLAARLPGPLRRAIERAALSGQDEFLRQTFCRFEQHIQPTQFDA